MHHPTDRVAHTTAFITPVVEHWLEREIVQWVHHERSIRRPIAPWANALTTELHLAHVIVVVKLLIFALVVLFCFYCQLRYVFFFLLFFSFFLVVILLRNKSTWIEINNFCANWSEFFLSSCWVSCCYCSFFPSFFFLIVVVVVFVVVFVVVVVVVLLLLIIIIILKL